MPSMNGSTTSGHLLETSTTTHLMLPHTFRMTAGPGARMVIVRFRLSSNVSA
jgi:hypothetical protein